MHDRWSACWRGTVLVVEDNDLDYERLWRSFQRLEFQGELVRAGDGVEALAWLGSNEATVESLVVVIDLNMPRLNGFELLAEMRDDPRHRTIPVHVLTTSARPADIAAAWNQAISGYHIKPTRLADLRDLLAILLGLWSLSKFDRSACRSVGTTGPA